MVADVLHSNRKKHSAKKGSVKKVKKISAKKSTQKGGTDLNKLLKYSSKKGDFESVKRLVELGANIHTEYDQPLVLSSKNGHLEIVKFLVENGANIRARNDEALVLSSKNGHLEIVKFLVENGANVHAQDDEALVSSSSDGHLEVVKFLVANGANIHAQDDMALRLSSEDGHFEVENFLLINAPDLTRVVANLRNRQARRNIQNSTPNANLNQEFITRVVEEYSSDFVSIQSSTESISNKEIKCTNVDLINMENYDTNSEDVFTIFYLNNLNKFSSNSCVSKNEMKEYLKAEKEDDPSLLTTLWKGGDKSGLGGKPTLKFIIKLPPNNVWITLGSFDRIMNSSIKKWYLLPLFGDKRRRIGYKYGASANHGQIPGSKIYKVFTKEEIISGIICKESDSDYPLYFKDFTIQDLSDGINSDVIIKTIKNHFL